MFRLAARRAAGAGACLFALSLLASLQGQHGAPLLIAFPVLLFLLAALRPFAALLVFAGLEPLAAMIVSIGGGTALRFVEAMALAFIAGVALHAVFRRTPWRPSPLSWPLAALASAVLASAAITAAVLAIEVPALDLGGAFPIALVHEYLFRQNTFAMALQLVEGLALARIAAALCTDQRRTEAAVRMMVAGATGAAALNVLRLVTGAMRAPDPWAALWYFTTALRINVHFSDWNAAGSYFVLVLALSLAVAAVRRSYAVVVPLLVAALWLTGSRAAFAAAVLVGLAAAAVLARRGRRTAVAAVLVLVAVGVAGWKWYPASRNDPAAFSFSTRLALSRAAVEMAEDYPLFGAGIGSFYDRSPEYAGDLLLNLGRERENAHDYFVQLAAELGIPGLLLFAAIAAAALRTAWYSLSSSPVAAGVFFGLIAYLVTCLSGHPLLVPEASYPFWIAIGAAAAAAVAGSGRGVRALCAVLIALYVVALPWRIVEARRHASLDSVTIGLSAWQQSPDVSRFRWAGPASTFYVDSEAVGIIIPLQKGPDGPDAVVAHIFIDGLESDRVELRAGQPWRRVRFLATQRQRGDFSRVDIRVSAAGGPPLAPAATRVIAVGLPVLIREHADGRTPESDVPLAADLDRDGRADLIVWTPSSGTWRWLSSSRGYDDAAVRSVRWREQALGSVPMTADLDGDGAADLVTWRPATSSFQWLPSSHAFRVSAAVTVPFPEAAAGDVPLLADLDGDRRADLILWRPSTATWLWRESGARYRQVKQRAGGAPADDLPIAADTDGDGRAELLVWSRWAAAAALGPRGGDSGRAADFDGDRRADPVLWNGATGAWRWLLSSAGYDPARAVTVEWGRTTLGDVPVLADLDGDGRPDLVIWRASTRTWYALLSSAQYQASRSTMKPWKF